jgi:hypothetical protein
MGGEILIAQSLIVALAAVRAIASAFCYHQTEDDGCEPEVMPPAQLDSAAQAVRLQQDTISERRPGARMLVMQEDSQRRSQLFAPRSYRLLEQETLDVVRQLAPMPDNRFAQGTIKLVRSFARGRTHEITSRSWTGGITAAEPSGSIVSALCSTA